MHVSRVRTNMKKGADVALGPKTLLLGKNGAGKSTILQAIELGLSGLVRDVEGRDELRLLSGLGRMFPPDQSAYVTLDISDGSKASWVAARVDGALKEPDHNVPVKAEWALQSLSALLAGDAKKIQSWLESVISPPLGDDLELLQLLPPDQVDAGRKVLKVYSTRDLLALAAQLKNDARKLRADSTKEEKQIATMTTGVAPPMLLELKQKLVLRVDELERRDLMQPQQRAALQAQLDQTRQAALEGESAVSGALATNETRLIAWAKLHQTYADFRGSPDCCWICGAKDAEKAIAQTRQTAENALRQTQEASKVHAAQQERRQRQEQLRMAVSAAEAALGRLHPENDESWRELAELRTRLATDSANAHVWANVVAARKTVEANRAWADAMVALAEVLETVGRERLVAAQTKFTAQVNAYLGGEAFGFDLTTGRIGFSRNGTLHTALSGAEGVRLLLALVAATSTGSGSTLIVVAPPDRGWDADTLMETMDILATAPNQIILMSTVAPRQWPAAWTVISL